MIGNPHLPKARQALAGLLGLAALAFVAASASASDDPAGSEGRFLHLSQHGNSNCSEAFLASIPKMSVTARLQGSCCAPM
jgi:hypothetical protein